MGGLVRLLTAGIGVTAAVWLHGRLRALGVALILFADRVRDTARSSPDTARSLAARLVSLHAVPIVVCVVTLLAPLEWNSTLRVLVFSPAVYLFWSVLHTVQTLAVRGLEHAVPSHGT